MFLVQLAKGFLIISIITTFISISIFSFSRERNPWVLLIVALTLTLGFFLTRAYLKEFFPFTDKTESFITIYWLLVFFVLIYRKLLSRNETTGILALALTLSLIVFLFSDKIKFPSPYLRTLWYPLHVPLSFASYAFWILAGGRAISLLKREESAEDSIFILDMCRKGFIYFTIAMIFGGIWGYLAWGSYFMWDPKILWSVILWFFYGNLIHLDNFPSFKRAKPHLYIIGFLLIFITFIGTGFFTRSIHRF